MQKKNVVLSSTEPITDGGRKYNYLYFLGAIGGFLFGIMYGNFGGGIFCAICGMVVALGIKNMICHQKDITLRHMTFSCSQKIPYERLIQRLQPFLLPLNMTIERGTGGEPVISFNGMIYDVSYTEDNTFTIWWRQSLAKAIITRNEYISVYRKASVAYGIIAYNIQQICNGKTEGYKNDSMNINAMIQPEAATICPECGASYKTDAKFCIKCGTNLEKVICPKCGNSVAVEDKFCIKCGNQL